MARWGIALLALMLGSVVGSGDAVAQGDTARQQCAVAFVEDGDTFNCRDGTRVRLLMVDAPEGGRFGDASRRALSTLVPIDATVRLETDREVHDDQGRVRAYVYLDDGRMVNDVMIRKGFAFFKPSLPNERHADRLRAAEEIARQKGIGVWSN